VKERLVTCNEEDTDCRARVTRDQECETNLSFPHLQLNIL